MLTFEGFTGINNVLREQRMKGSDLIAATDVDIGLSGEISRRAGLTQESTDCHKNLWQAQGYQLATCGSVLTAIQEGGGRHALLPTLGSDRVWYCDLPDGRVAFSNGMQHGVTDGLTAVPLAVPAPQGLGSPDQEFGSLLPGQYRYHLSYTRLADRLEGPAVSSTPFEIAQGGLRLDGLPQRSGHAINVYLSGKDGEGAYLAGVAAGDAFTFAGDNMALMLPCRTVGALPFPVGTILATWRGRLLTAQGNVLWASRPGTTHLSDLRDFRQFTSPITLIQPVDDGIYVGTTQDLVFLGGTAFDSLVYSPSKRGPVVLGSGVAAPGHRIKLGDGSGAGAAMLCIAGGEIVAGFGGGQTTSLTANRYRTAATEVCATFREVDGIPQYLAVPQ